MPPPRHVVPLRGFIYTDIAGELAPFGPGISVHIPGTVEEEMAWSEVPFDFAPPLSLRPSRVSSLTLPGYGRPYRLWLPEPYDLVGYHFLLWGMLATPLDDPTAPIFEDHVHSEKPYIVAYHREVHITQIDVILIATWDPIQGLQEFIDHNASYRSREADKDTRQAIDLGWDLLARKGTRGRPVRDPRQVYTDFVAKYFQARVRLKQQGYPNPIQAAIATEMDMAVTTYYATIRLFKQHKLPWPPDSI